jgi:hypothetical protein
MACGRCWCLLQRPVIKRHLLIVILRWRLWSHKDTFGVDYLWSKREREKREKLKHKANMFHVCFWCDTQFYRTSQHITAKHTRLIKFCVVPHSPVYDRRYYEVWPPLWSSGQTSWLLTQRSRLRFPELPDFLSSSGSGTGSTQPREDKGGATWRKNSGSGL